MRSLRSYLNPVVVVGREGARDEVALDHVNATAAGISAEAAQRRVLGLPAQTAVVYLSLFVLAFVIYSRLWSQAPIVASDSGGYLAVASDLADFRVDRLHYRAPGFPLLLLATGSTAVPTRELFYVSLLLDFAAIWILASVLHAAGSTRATIILFGVLLLLPPYVESAAYVLTENLTKCTLALACGALAFWCRSRETRWLLIAAFAIGYAGLIRPTYQALACVMSVALIAPSVLYGAAFLRERKALRASVVLIAVAGMLVGGYTLLNYVKFGHLGMSLVTPVDSATLSTRTARVIERLPDEHAAIRELLVRARDAELVRRTGPHTGYAYLSHPGVVQDVIDVSGLEGPELARQLFRLNLLLIREAPLEYLHEVSRSFSVYWFPASTSLANAESRSLQALWGAIHLCVMTLFAGAFVLLTGGIPFVRILWRVRRAGDDAITRALCAAQHQLEVFLLAGAVVVYTALVSSFFETGDPRYRVPTDGLIVLMTFVGIEWIRRSIACARASLTPRNGE